MKVMLKYTDGAEAVVECDNCKFNGIEEEITFSGKIKIDGVLSNANIDSFWVKEG